jgi:hypothetical protein
LADHRKGHTISLSARQNSLSNPRKNHREREDITFR